MKRHSYRLTLEPLEERAMLSTCHVTRLGDTGNGSGLRGDLRFCIEKINTDGGPAVIDFFKTGTIKLETPLPYINVEVHIQGPGSDLLTIDGQQKTRVIAVSARGTVTISGITLTNGKDFDKNGGGGIYNQGVLVVENCAIEGNNGYGRGGGIYNQGNLTVLDTTVTGNELSLSPYTSWGGGIYNSVEGSLWVHNSRIAGNDIPSSYSFTAVGGGIANLGLAAISNTTISGNTATVPEDWLFWGGLGGGIYNGGDLLVDSSLIANNIVAGDFYGNGGGIANGGCTNESFCATHYPAGTVRVVNSTIANNLAFAAGDGFGEALGGGISNRPGGIVTLNHSTVAGNRAERYHAYVQAKGGGIGSVGTLQVQNSIIAGNDAVSAGDDLSGVLASSGYNVFQNASGGSGYSQYDALNIDPLLGPLTDNGGPTLTMALLPGSRAIDAGNPNPADPPQWDQRGLGYERIENGTVDIGAFEVQTTGIELPHGLLAVLSTADFETEDPF